MSGACHMDSDGRSAVWLLVWKRSVASGRLLRVSGEWYGYAFGLPDRHPMVFLALWRGSMPVMDGPVVVGTSGGSGGAWWFENWIVDASKRNSLLFSFCLSRFRQASFFGSLVSRSIVL